MAEWKLTLKYLQDQLTTGLSHNDILKWRQKIRQTKDKEFILKSIDLLPDKNNRDSLLISINRQIEHGVPRHQAVKNTISLAKLRDELEYNLGVHHGISVQDIPNELKPIKENSYILDRNRRIFEDIYNKKISIKEASKILETSEDAIREKMKEFKDIIAARSYRKPESLFKSSSSKSLRSRSFADDTAYGHKDQIDVEYELRQVISNPAKIDEVARMLELQPTHIRAMMSAPKSEWYPMYKSYRERHLNSLPSRSTTKWYPRPLVGSDTRVIPRSSNNDLDVYDRAYMDYLSKLRKKKRRSTKLVRKKIIKRKPIKGRVCRCKK